MRKAVLVLLLLLLLLNVLGIASVAPTISPLPDEYDDFFFLASIIHKETSQEQTDSEKLATLTDWLSTNVLSTWKYPGWGKASEYPEWFNGRSAVTVIKGGIGNCGYQTENIIALAKVLGVTRFKRHYLGKETGSKHWNTFAEIYVDGSWRVYDPNTLLYIKAHHHGVLSLAQILSGRFSISNIVFESIANELKEHPAVLQTVETKGPQLYLPYGIDSYFYYDALGETILKAHIFFQRDTKIILALATALIFLEYAAWRSLLYASAYFRMSKARDNS